MHGKRFAILLLVLAPGAHAATVRGRLLQTVAGNSIPAGGVAVTLQDKKTGKRSFAVTSDSSGMYYFQNVPEADFLLQVWKAPSGPPSSVDITVREPLTDVNPLNLP